MEDDSIPITEAAGLIERRRIEGALRDSEARLAVIVDSAMDAIVTVDEGQRVLLFNRAAEKMFRCPASEAIGQPLDRFIPARFRAIHSSHIRSFGQAGVTTRAMAGARTVYGLRSDGEEFPVEASISQVEAEGQKLYTVIMRDVTERLRHEEQLREQAELLDHAREAILVRDLEGRILFWNKGAEHLYGWTAAEALGRHIRELQFQNTMKHFEEANLKAMEQGEWIGELTQITKDGRKIITEGHWTLVRTPDGRPRSILVINADVTEKKKLEAQYLRAQRMESIGTLAGGIAHDLNNILSPILMAVQILQSRVHDESSRRMLSLLQANAERGGEMVRQVLSFARGVEGEHALLQPVHLVREIVRILKETFPKDIEISFNFLPDLWLVTGGATQIHQVLMNLCVNARDAMPGGGQLGIGAENVTLGDQYAQMNLDARPGRYVLITVADTGTGIPPEIIDQIFDPFFTTKEQDKGTGLGLSTVIGIVKSHGGFVNVYSEAGNGTKFMVYLPASEAGQATSPNEEKQKLPFGNGELILVADDESAIREITRETLEAFNYRVLTAGDGAEAVALYAQHRNDIAVVITDMMMPFMDGPATIRALQKLNPLVRVIAATGLKANGKVTEAASAGVRIFLTKPFTAEKLLKSLAEILSGGS
ncbi:MAG TPA: PAS domain S-box protein [Blastocatellia bacterium]|nr:PAS domain S-box protein [Blastocatellia bacterium]